MTIKNMYMTPLEYENFSGVKRSTKLYFHLTPREFTDWMLENREQADKLMGDFMLVRGDVDDNDANAGQFTSEDVRIMLRMVKVLAELSYGIPSDDGEVFDKSGIQRFIHSAAYDAFRMFLFENPNELEHFFSSVLNEEVVKAFGERMAKLEEEALENAENVKAIQAVEDGSKRPQDMTREELMAAFQAKNQLTSVPPVS